jgi:hypothetical protein
MTMGEGDHNVVERALVWRGARFSAPSTTSWSPSPEIGGGKIGPYWRLNLTSSEPTGSVMVMPSSARRQLAKPVASMPLTKLCGV